jgi:hypothetical protein
MTVPNCSTIALQSTLVILSVAKNPRILPLSISAAEEPHPL